MPTLSHDFTFTNDHQEVKVQAAVWYSSRDWAKLSIRCWELDTGKVYIPQPYQFETIEDFFTTVINQRRLNMTQPKARNSKPRTKPLPAETPAASTAKQATNNELTLQATVNNQKVFLDAQTKQIAGMQAHIARLDAELVRLHRSIQARDETISNLTAKLESTRVPLNCPDLQPAKARLAKTASPTLLSRITALFK